MLPDNDKRRDPFAGLGSGEPVRDLGLTGAPAVLNRRPAVNGRQKPPHPSEKRRRKRQLSATFSDARIIDRLRALGERWGMLAPDGRSPNVSAVLEYLLLPQMEAAERGEIEPPRGV